ncbi:histidine kinase [Chloroflexota bacterium]
MNLYALVPLISFLAYVTLIALIYRLPQSKARKNFSVYIFSAMMWSFSSFMLHANYFPEQTLWWNRSVVVCLLWMTIAYYHFIRAFTNRTSGLGVYLGYTCLLVLAVFLSLGSIIKDSYVIDGVLYHDLGIWLYIMGAVLITYAVAAAVLLVQQYRHSTNILDRNRIAYLLIGLFIVVPFVSSNLISSLAKYPIDHVGNLGNALIISYVILKLQLLDIKVVFRRGIAYSMSTVLFTSFYLLLMFIVQEFFFNWTGYTTVAAAVGFALLIAALFHPLRNLIQRFVDRLFYREAYDYRQILLNLTDRMSNVLDIEELADNMLYPITKALNASRTYLMLPHSEGNDFIISFVYPKESNNNSDKAMFSKENPVINWLDQEGIALSQDQLDMIPEFKGLWKVEKDALRGFDLFCPIKSKGNLIGILALGKKLSGDPYSNEDIDLLMTIATGAALAIENAGMLDNLQKQRLRMEQLLTETVQTQEDERQRIAAELHDSVAQWLVGASYHAQTCDKLLSEHNNAKAIDELHAMESTIAQSLKELRRVLAGLRPLALDELGLTHALEKSLEELKSDGVICRFQTVGAPSRFPSSVEIATYRIVQEALSNVRKHASATAVRLILSFKANRLIIEISDNGKGFNFPKVIDSAISVGNMGLLGMQQRVDSLDGTINVNTSEGSGTSIMITIPVDGAVHVHNEENTNGNN